MRPAVAPPAPATLEAHVPPPARDAVRLLVVGIPPGGVRHARFPELPEILSAGDLLVVNTSATIPAALPARRDDGSAVVLHLSTPVAGARDRWVVELRRDDRRADGARAGERLALRGGATARLLEPFSRPEAASPRSRGARLWVAELDVDGPLLAYLGRHGAPIRYAHVHGHWPLSAYQTVFASEPGSAEMPSAGRPFTAALLGRLAARAVDVAPIVLHTGVSSLEHDEAPYPERFHVPAATAARVAAARRRGGRVIAVGTTVVRALESAASPRGAVRAAAGWTDLVLGPERDARVVDGVLSGFHDAGASHLRLLEAVARRRVLARAARAAGGAGYRRHEFGDVQLLVRAPRRLAVAGRQAAAAPAASPGSNAA
jgi:S-adenosylmethionine:tRNA ribosyltransferase-isomerase